MDRALLEVVNHPGQHDYQIELFDVSGRLLRSEQQAGPVLTMQRAGLTEGMYFYRLSSEDGFLSSGKIVVNH